jgi:starch-binding outer membrane protein, SusD/RagB family
MKNIIAILSLCAIGFQSCNDFLEEENKSNATAEEYYATEVGFESLINANYSQLREIYGQAPWLFCAGTDLYSEGRDAEPTGTSLYTDLNSSSASVAFLYTQCYDAINKANSALYFADITEKTANLEKRKGEAMFLRANAYFLLVQTYGGVTLKTTPTQEALTSFSRNSAEEIYTQIISDLEAALPLVEDGTFNGRVNKRAVNDMLAKVHLTRSYESFAASDDATKAATYADAAIAGQTLDLSFDNIWTPGNDMNAETIFSVQFSTGSIATSPTTLGNQQQNYFGSYLGGSEVTGKAPYKMYALCPTKFAVDLFEETDVRWGVTFMTEAYTRYFDFFDVADKSTLTVAHFYEPKWFDAVDRAAYQLAHPTATYHNYGVYDSDGSPRTNNYEVITVKKFDDPAALFAGPSLRTSSRDFIVARLGETYLIAAEAYLKAGNRANALARLNEVRKRAGVANAVDADLNIDYILDERARELFGEYKRWFDLKRTGKLIERAVAHHPLITSAAAFDGANGEKKILRPIPQAAIDLNRNKSFAQNPAYN